MKNYVMRLSASGVLVLSAVGCGSNETSAPLQAANHMPIPTPEAAKIADDSCFQAPENLEMEQYLNQLQKQGRLTDCALEVQFINAQQISLPPDE